MNCRAGICYIQAILGHADPATTEDYTRVGATKLKALQSDTHPARPMGTCNAAGQPQAPGDALFAALDTEADASGEMT